MFQVNIVDYYSSEEQRLHREVEENKKNAVNSPLGKMFITFSKINDSMRVFQDHNKYRHVNIFQWNIKPQESKVSKALNSKNWKVWYAPPPSDIHWENLALKRHWLLLRSIVVNIVLLLVLLFLTTPEYIANQLEPILNSIYGMNY